MESQLLKAGVVLVVDDDVDVLTAVQHLLECEGYRVLAEADPRQGLKVYADHWQEVRVVVLDYHMRRLRGDELLKRLQQINTAVRVIVVTGDAEGIVRRFDGHQLVRVLAKPFAVAGLLDLVSGSMDSPHAQDVVHPAAA